MTQPEPTFIVYQVNYFHLLTPGHAEIEEHEARRRALEEQFNPRERLILPLLVRGLQTKQIAERLNFSPNTIETDVKRIISILGAETRTEAAFYALVYGLVSLPADPGPENDDPIAA